VIQHGQIVSWLEKANGSKLAGPEQISAETAAHDSHESDAKFSQLNNADAT